jgi:6-pyruvoyltetrahydropterin/6-carboxytetrahydropterin synthase
VSTVIYRAAAHFEAARKGFHLHARHAPKAFHGHSFRVEIGAQGEPALMPGSGIESDQLRARLVAAVEPLDFALLNEVMDQPSDEGLSQWMLERLGLRSVEWLNCWCGPAQGFAWVAGQGHHWQRHRLEAAHQLPHVPKGHKCGRMHGHGFEVILFCQPQVQATLESVWQPLHQQLHHACLNHIPGLENPTSENLCTWLWNSLSQRMEGITAVLVSETPTSGALYNGQQHIIWKDFHFDSAIQLKGLAPGDSRANLHGHTWHLRLSLSAPLDTVLGWAVDYGDVKEMFQPIHKSLDHRALHEQGFPHNRALAEAIFAQAREVLPATYRLDLMDTPGTGVSLCARSISTPWGL